MHSITVLLHALVIYESGKIVMRKLLILVLSGLILSTIIVVKKAGSLAAPQMSRVGKPPTTFPAQAIEIPNANGAVVAGWFAEGEVGKPGLLLLHSVRSDRREMLSRAHFLYEAGYSILMIDMQAHGETPGEQITFGFRESLDVHAAVRYLESLVHPQKVGAIGVSMGGAALLLGGSPVDADAVILEAVYSSIEKAVSNRISIRLGPFGHYLAPLFTWQIEPRLEVRLEDLSPLNEIGQLNAPVLIVGGTEDRHTSAEETQRLFEAARSPKELWLIEGAAHQNFHHYAGEEYERRILLFLRKYLEVEGA
jgi:alpha-beta hydrolase superfamily lysophospholipase